MWYYRRRLSVHPIACTVTFAGKRLQVSAEGCVVSPIDEDLELKMKRAPHVFIFKADAVEVTPEVEKVETSSIKDDNVEEPKRSRRKRKVQQG